MTVTVGVTHGGIVGESHTEVVGLVGDTPVGVDWGKTLNDCESIRVVHITVEEVPTELMVVVLGETWKESLGGGESTVLVGETLLDFIEVYMEGVGVRVG